MDLAEPFIVEGEARTVVPISTCMSSVHVRCGAVLPQDGRNGQVRKGVAWPRAGRCRCLPVNLGCCEIAESWPVRMNPVRVTCALTAGAMIASNIGAAIADAVIPPTWKNFTRVIKKYPHGVGRWRRAPAVGRNRHPGG